MLRESPRPRFGAPVVDLPLFDLIEVKSTTSAKPEHIPDAAIQLYVLENAGVAVNSAYLMHINNRYVYAGGDYDLEQLFTLEDVTEDARAVRGRYRARRTGGHVGDVAAG